MPRRKPSKRKTSDERKRHITHFHRGDWAKDPGVKMLDSFEKGIWVELIFLVEECEPRGYAMKPNGYPMTISEIADSVGTKFDEPQRVMDTIEKLVEVGVASLDLDGRSATRGAIFCRRIVRDEKIRKQNVENGRKGGSPVLTGSASRTYLKNPSTIETNDLQDALKPRFTGLPVESKKEEPIGSSKEKKKATRISVDFQPDPEVVSAMKIECPEVDQARELRRMIDHFIAAPGAKGLKKDWDATYRNWIRTAHERGVQRGQFKTAAEKRDEGFERSLGRISELNRPASLGPRVGDQRAIEAGDRHN
jgi:hypothetical protein